MLEAIIRRFRLDKRGVSNVIVVMLSLVLVVIIVGNVIMWSYQMNQLDLERMQETVTISNVTRITRSPWFTAQTEFSIVAGSRIAGAYGETKLVDNAYETFREDMEFELYRLRIDNDLLVDLSSFPLSSLKECEASVRYRSSEDGERWFLKAYNWTGAAFSDAGFNSTFGSQPVSGEWNEYAVNITSEWASYVRNDGVVRLGFSDEALTMNQTMVDIDFFAVRVIVDGCSFEFQNSSPFTSHLVAVWIVNSTFHERFAATLFINSGEQIVFNRVDIALPENDFVVKIVTERGNISVFPIE